MISDLKIIPFGEYKPKSNTLFLRLLTKLGLSRGKIANWNRQLWKAKGYVIVDYEIRGIKYRLNILRNTYDGKLLTSSKYINKKELFSLIPRNKESTFIDIGANIGYFSLCLAKMGYENVFAIEPNPATLELLRTNVAINNLSNKIKIVPYCVGNDEILTMYSRADLGSSSVLKDNGDISSEAIQVESKKLERIINEYNIKKIDGMKVDIEGYEDRALLPFFEEVDEKLWPKIIVIEYTCRSQWKKDILSVLYKKGYTKCYKTRGNLILRYEKYN